MRISLRSLAAGIFNGVLEDRLYSVRRLYNHGSRRDSRVIHVAGQAFLKSPVAGGFRGMWDLAIVRAFGAEYVGEFIKNAYELTGFGLILRGLLHG